MDDTTPIEYTLASLADASGVSARTIRYYISQNLLPPPLTVGRKAAYGRDHLLVLQRIADAKAQGRTLDEIRQQLEGARPSALPNAQAWFVQQPTDDVAVFVRGNISPKRRKQIDRAMVPFVEAVTRMQYDSEEEG